MAETSSNHHRVMVQPARAVRDDMPREGRCRLLMDPSVMTRVEPFATKMNAPLTVNVQRFGTSLRLSVIVSESYRTPKFWTWAGPRAQRPSAGRR